MVSIPMADIWQDDAWREQQRRLLEAQFGPHEVESLAQNAVLPLQQETADGSEDPLMWVQAKELRELQVGSSHLPRWDLHQMHQMHGQELQARGPLTLHAALMAGSKETHWKLLLLCAERRALGGNGGAPLMHRCSLC